MSISTEMVSREQIQTIARRARLASINHEALTITPDTAGLLATYLREALAVAEDQAWFWTKEWQTGEQEAEADLTDGRHQTFDTMDDLLDDLGWPR